MKHVSVNRRGERFIVYPTSRTVHGVWIASDPCVAIGVDCSEAELGTVVLSALEASKSSVPHPTDWSRTPDPVLDAAGVKTWSEFDTDCISVDVEDPGDRFEFVPRENKGADEGSEEISEKTSSNEKPSTPELIGAALREAFSHAR